MTFKKKNSDYTKQLNACAVIHGRLQKHGLPQNVGQRYLNKFHKIVQRNKRPGQLFYRFPLKNHYAKLGNHLETVPLFCSGLDKIQNEKFDLITQQEREE